ncbi:ZrgA family zinc uptake protein [Marinobacter sp.]|uniref:ZrgA family zinc uptake protein n=1 Tax=Marinobacter sp. TaxID=50741 RepID=UPI003A9566CA
MLPKKLPAQILAAATILTTAPLSANATNNPGTHQHGHAELQLAISNNQIDLIFISPAYNLLGFEHEARTGEQKASVKETIAWLGATPLVNTPESSCRVQDANVPYEASAGDGDQRDHGHDHNEEPAGHSDIEVIQSLTCSGLEDSNQLTTPLTARFPELEHLSLEWVWSEGQGSGRLAQGESLFKLTTQ